MPKKLLLLELNEFDFEFFLYGAKKYNFPLIKDFFKDKKKLNTFTDDKKEGFNLDPWVQWVSVHTGKSSKEHKIFRLGQKLDKKYIQIWEEISKKKIKSTIWGAFNSTLNKRKNIILFFPDPWSFQESAYPKNFNTFLQLPRYYAQNYPRVSKLKTLIYGLFFVFKFLFSPSIFFLLKNSYEFIKIFALSGLKSFNLYFTLDLFSLLILKNNLKKNNSNFTIIALNSFAHYQHNYWDGKKYEYVYFWYLDKMINIIKEIGKDYSSEIIFNGFSQKKIKNEFHLRPKEPKSFFKKLNLNFLKIEPNMTTGAIVNFKSFKDKIKALNKIRDIKIYDYPLFEIQDFKNEKKFFYKFSLVSMKDSYDKRSLNLSHYKKYFKKPIKIYKFKKIDNKDKLLLDIILKNIEFIKSTSKHVPEGVLLYRNFHFNKKEISKQGLKNTNIFKSIVEYFK